MLFRPELIPLSGFLGLMLTAAFEDFRRFVIPNRLTAAMLVLWPIYLAMAPRSGALFGALACAALVFTVGAFLFSRGFIGGGDVKLLAVAALWAGPSETPSLLAATGILGGVLALALVTPVGAQLAAAARVILAPAEPAEAAGSRTRIPYGVAIALAALIVTVTPVLN